MRNAPLLLVDDIRERRLRADEFGVDSIERFEAARVGEETGDGVQKVVAGRALHRPLFWQRLVAREDLLDDEVEGRLPQRCESILEPAEVLGWIVQSLDVGNLQ